jgi:hypothetical protein
MGGMYVQYAPKPDNKGIIQGDPKNLMTNIDGLYALGECNYQYHGANRLGANALLSCTFDGLFGGFSIVNYARTNASRTEAPASLFDDAVRAEESTAKSLAESKGTENPYAIGHELGEEVGVAAEADDELPGADLPSLLQLLELRDHVRHALAGPGRRRRAEGLRLHVDEAEEMAVAVDEARHERLAREVGDLGPLAFVLHHVGLGADGHDPPARDRHRLGRRLPGIHGDDFAAADDPVGRRGDRHLGDGESRGNHSHEGGT